MSGQTAPRWTLLLAAVSGVMVVALLAVATVALRAMVVSEQVSVDIAQNDLTALRDAAELQGLLYQRGFAAEFFLTGDLGWIDKLHQAQPAFERWLATVSADSIVGQTSRPQATETARLASTLAAEYARYDIERTRAVVLFRAGDREQALTLLNANTAHAERLRDLANGLIAVRRSEIERRLESAHHAWRRALVGLALAIFIAVLGAAVCGYLLARRVAQQMATSAARLAEQRLRLQQAEKMSALGEMATLMAHEVLNPLTGIKTAVQLLARATPTASETARLVDGEILRVEALARRLMSFARPLQPHPAPTALAALAEELTAATRAEALQREVGVDVDFSSPGRVGAATIIADGELLMHALTNLTLNALQASPVGARVKITAQRDGTTLLFRVTDQGRGIDPEIRSRLFLPFVTSKPEGHGLGLAWSQNIAVAHGGRIEARANSPLPGTTFCLFLPENA